MQLKKYMIVALSILFLAGCGFNKQETTNNIFLIPEGFEGSIFTFYNMPDEPALKKEDDYTVIPVKEKTLDVLKDTEISQYGVSFTSTKDMIYGVVNDKYYYVDKNGKRKEINDQCISLGSNGGFSGRNGEDIKYSVIQVTSSSCGPSFKENGRNDFNAQVNHVGKYYFQKLAIKK